MLKVEGENVQTCIGGRLTNTGRIGEEAKSRGAVGAASLARTCLAASSAFWFKDVTVESSFWNLHRKYTLMLTFALHGCKILEVRLKR